VVVVAASRVGLSTGVGDGVGDSVAGTGVIGSSVVVEVVGTGGVEVVVKKVVVVS
jgi:hypothetical protein